MEAAIRKLSVTIPVILLALLIFIVTGCKSTVAPTAVLPSSPSAKTGTPVKLVFTTQPDEKATARSTFDTQPVVAVKDTEGNVVTSYRGHVVLSITEGTGDHEATLFGGTTVAIVNGMVEFSELSIDKAGTDYTLTATSGTLATGISTPFTILPGAPVKLTFTIQPSGGVAGSPLTMQPEVTVLDLYRNKVTSYEGSVTLYLSGLSGAALSGKTTARVVNSVAKFSDISIDVANPSYQLTAMSNSLKSATSRAFTIVEGEPTKLVFTVQPSGAKAGTPFETQPKVAIADFYGNVVTSSRASVTLSITPGTGTAGATLSGIKTLIAEGGLGGLAVFTDLSIDWAGSGYILTATSSGLTSATSQAFDMMAP